MASTITVEEFEDLIYNGYARTHGQPFIKWTQRAELRAFVSRQLRSFVEQTMCLYDDNVTFSLTSADDGTYDLLDEDVFSSAVLQPEYVVIASNPCTNAEGLPGMVSVAEANNWAYDYRTVADAQPQKALLIPPNTLRLIPAPDATYSGVVCGWVQHFDLTADGTYDTTNLNLRHGSIDAAAAYIAGELLLPGAEGPAVEKAVGLRELGLSKAQKATSRANSFLAGFQTRGPRRSYTYQLS